MRKDSSHRTDSSRPQQVTDSVDGSGTSQRRLLPLLGHDLGKALISISYFFPSRFLWRQDLAL